MVNVPQAYAGLVSQMSQATGLPQNVIAAQAQDESGFSPTAVSPAGAEGWLQFLPSTYNTYTSQAGVAAGTEFNPADESKVYDIFMKQLLSDEKGNVRDALAAYNAGEGNIAAGYGYADSILSAAGTGNITVSGNPSASTTSALGIPGLPNPLNLLIPGGSLSGFFASFFEKLFGGTIRDYWERGLLMLLGFVLVIVGIKILSSGSGKQAINIQTSSGEASESTPEESTTKQTTSRRIKTPVSQHTRTTSNATKTVTADEAIEAAAVA